MSIDMTKVKKTALEIAEMLRYQLAERELRVGVFAKGNSWYAKVYAVGDVEKSLQRRVDAAVAILADRYDLDSR